MVDPKFPSPPSVVNTFSQPVSVQVTTAAPKPVAPQVAGKVVTPPKFTPPAPKPAPPKVAVDPDPHPTAPVWMARRRKA